MDRVKSLLFIVCVAVCFAAGCSQPQRGETSEPLCLTGLDRQVAFSTAEDVLGRMNFTIAKSDIEQGIIRTRPLPGAQWFEFWRGDSTGGFNAAEASLHSIRRTVEINIDSQLCISCNTKVERLCTTDDGRPFASLTMTLDTSSLLSRPSSAWVDLGPDVKLETKILNKIKQRITKKPEKEKSNIKQQVTKTSEKEKSKTKQQITKRPEKKKKHYGNISLRRSGLYRQ